MVLKRIRDELVGTYEGLLIVFGTATIIAGLLIHFLIAFSYDGELAKISTGYLRDGSCVIETTRYYFSDPKRITYCERN